MTFISGVIGTSYSKDLNQNDSNLSSDRKTMMLTGFWNPSGQMISQFSIDPELNPNGWNGENGMFEVDYQDTWEDFWSVTDQIKPFAIISFGAGAGPWEIEYNARNLDSWINDEESPYKPTPNPPDDTVPVNYVRHSTLPVQQIADAINEENLLDAWVDWDGNPGKYLCEYIAYLGMWYQSIHNQSADPNPCKVAGFVHVNADVSVDDAKIASEITIRETIEYLSLINSPPELPNISGPTNGKFGENYEYTISAIDPEGDNVYYWIEWFDDCPGVFWDGPYKSGEEIKVSNSWDQQGTYTISVRAKDSNGAISDTATLTVTMPKNKYLWFNILDIIKEKFLFLFNIF
jgi:pyrrolidone-carboxylate peptidase